MKTALNARLAGRGREAGFTLVELLVASAMGVVVLGAVGSLVISAMRNQPEISKRSQTITTARWVLERLTREIRNGIVIDQASANSVSFQTYVRHTTCGGSVPLPSGVASIPCEVTYTCSATSCTRIEALPKTYSGTPTTIFEGINNADVFSYVPSEDPTYIKITLRFPNPSGPAALTVSDGASLRNATLTY